MFGNAITLVINLLSAIQWIEKDDELQRKILEIVRDQIDLALKPKKTIAEMRSIYEREGKIPAIKEWRIVNDGMGIKDAKDAIEAAASTYHWQDFRVGRCCVISSRDSNWDTMTGEISRVADNGFYVKFIGRHDDIFFHQSAVTINQ